MQGAGTLPRADSSDDDVPEAPRQSVCYRTSCGRSDAPRYYTGPDGPLTLCSSCYQQYHARKLVLYQHLRTGRVSVRQTSASRPVRVTGFELRSAATRAEPRKRKPSRDLTRPIVAPVDNVSALDDLDLQSISSEEEAAISAEVENSTDVQMEDSVAGGAVDAAEHGPGEGEMDVVENGFGESIAATEKTVAGAKERGGEEEDSDGHAERGDVADSPQKSSNSDATSSSAHKEDAADEFDQDDRRHLLAACADDSDSEDSETAKPAASTVPNFEPNATVGPAGKAMPVSKNNAASGPIVAAPPSARNDGSSKDDAAVLKVGTDASPTECVQSGDPDVAVQRAEEAEPISGCNAASETMPAVPHSAKNDVDCMSNAAVFDVPAKVPLGGSSSEAEDAEDSVAIVIDVDSADERDASLIAVNGEEISAGKSDLPRVPGPEAPGPGAPGLRAPTSRKRQRSSGDGEERSNAPVIIIVDDDSSDDISPVLKAARLDGRNERADTDGQEAANTPNTINLPQEAVKSTDKAARDDAAREPMSDAMPSGLELDTSWENLANKNVTSVQPLDRPQPMISVPEPARLGATTGDDAQHTRRLRAARQPDQHEPDNGLGDYSDEVLDEASDTPAGVSGTDAGALPQNTKSTIQLDRPQSTNAIPQVVTAANDAGGKPGPQSAVRPDHPSPIDKTIKSAVKVDEPGNRANSKDAQMGSGDIDAWYPSRGSIGQLARRRPGNEVRKHFVPVAAVDDDDEGSAAGLRAAQQRDHRSPDGEDTLDAVKAPEHKDGAHATIPGAANSGVEPAHQIISATVQLARPPPPNTTHDHVTSAAATEDNSRRISEPVPDRQIETHKALADRPGQIENAFSQRVRAGERLAIPAGASDDRDNCAVLKSARKLPEGRVFPAEEESQRDAENPEALEVVEVPLQRVPRPATWLPGSHENGEEEFTFVAADALQGMADTDTLDSQMPGTQVPDTRVPDAQVPHTPMPDMQAPDVQAPDAEAPDTQAPDTQTTVTMSEMGSMPRSAQTGPPGAMVPLRGPHNAKAAGDAGSVSGVNSTSHSKHEHGFEISVKAGFEGSFRRLRISSRTTFEEFTAELRRVFHLKREFVVSYLDDEGDRVALSSDYDMPEMFNLVKQTAMTPLRVLLETKPDGQPEVECIVIDD